MADRDVETSISNYSGAIDAIGIVLDRSPDDLDRRRAIALGHLARTRGLMRSLLLLFGDDEHNEAIFALTRLILETTTNLRYLLAKDDPELYSAFVYSGLKADVDLFDDIESKIASRGPGPEWNIEAGMKQSVKRYVTDSGTTVEKVRESKRYWAGSYYDRLKELGEEDGYLYFQRMPSSAVHGDWSNTLRFHLHKGEVGYRPWRGSIVPVDSLFNPVTAFVCQAVIKYIQVFHPDKQDFASVVEDIFKAVMEAERQSGDFEPAAGSDPQSA